MRIALLGPIGHWWNDNWGTPAHREYVAWRQELHDALVAAGHLVYSPHNAWKGEWDANDGDATAQAVNDAAIRAVRVALDMTPTGVPSPGTGWELKLCADIGRIVLPAPPGAPVFALLTLLRSIECVIEREAA